MSSGTTATASGASARTAAPGSSVGSGTMASATATGSGFVGSGAAGWLSSGAKAGNGVGAVVLVTCLLGVAILLLRRIRRRRIERQAATSGHGLKDRYTEMEQYPELSTVGERHELLDESRKPELEVTPQLLSVHWDPIKLPDNSQSRSF